MSQIQGIQPAQSNPAANHSNLTRIALLTTITLVTILLTLGYALGKLWLEVPIVFLFGILWGVCVLRNFRRLASLFFIVLMIASGVGYLAGVSTPLRHCGRNGQSIIR